jgi:hypothetical protein
VHYWAKDKAVFQDFNKSHEWLGGGATTYQRKIISRKVFEILHAEKIKNLRVEPVVFD